ncbi:MAG: class I SAM-dependent methyltransferase, partial [Bryobacteraceae bacterium]
MKDVYLNPTPDRVVDNKMMEMIADCVIGKVAGRRVLELGVGEQIWTPKLVDRFAEVTSVDGCQDLLAEMQSRLSSHPEGSRWTPVHAYFEEYATERRFDTVFVTYVLEHVDDPGLIIKRAGRLWLEPGGLLVVVVPHALSLHRRLAVKMGLAKFPGELGETDRRLGHKHCFT